MKGKRVQVSRSGRGQARSRRLPEALGDASAYRDAETRAAEATRESVAGNNTNLYRTSAIFHRRAAEAARAAGLPEYASGHEEISREHDAVADRLRDAWYAVLRTGRGAVLEEDVARIVARAGPRKR